MLKKLEYINRKYKPTKKDLTAKYYVEPNKMTIEEAAENIASESSIGTWTTISTMNKEIAKKLKPKIYKIDKKNNLIWIAYPEDLFEKSNIPEILSSIAGNIFGMKAIKNLKFLDVDFPDSFIKAHKGPQYGISGIRKITGVKKRPLCGTIVKPKVGLTPKQHAKVAYDSWRGGLDVVKDDENLSSMVFNPFRERMREVLKLRKKAEKETGEVKIYMPNITAEVEEMKRRADYVKEQGGRYVMIDILTVGWSALQTMRNYCQKKKLVIHAHRAMHAAMTRNPKHGISMLVLAKFARLIGVDQLHIGTAAVGKMHGSRTEELAIEEEVETQTLKETHQHLKENWHGLKKVFAVASGGLHPGKTQELIKVMGKNIVIQCGGGCHGHPDGTYAGAKAIRQSVDAAMKGIKNTVYAKTHPELKKAIEKWGYR